MAAEFQVNVGQSGKAFDFVRHAWQSNHSPLPGGMPSKPKAEG
jgi:hypothetical protein